MMVKKEYFLFILVFILFHCSHQEKTGPERIIIEAAKSIKQTDCEKFGLKGKVKQWIRQSYGFTVDSGTRGKILLSKELYVFNESCMKILVKGFNEKNEMISEALTSYNDNGNIAEERYYDSNDVLLVKVNYYYDFNGDIIKEIKEDATGNVTYTSLWKYDANGNNIEYINSMDVEGGNGILTRIKKGYDNKGTMILEDRIEYRIDGSIHLRKKIHYDKSGKKTKDSEYDGKGKMTNKTSYDYNKEGKLVVLKEYFYNYQTDKYDKRISLYIYDKKGNLLKSSEPGRMTVCQYDMLGNKTEVAEYDERDTLLYKLCISYDEKNLTSKEIRTNYKEDGSTENTYVYIYDESGKLILWAKYDYDGRLVYEHRTLYDENGNKIEEVKDSTVQLPKIRYRYKFDEMGNHIETLCFRLNDRDEPELAMSYEYLIAYRE